MCGSTWGSLAKGKNAFTVLGTSTARYGCCPVNKYMSSPEVNPFKEADSCSACPVGQVSLVPNDDTRETICQKICPSTQVLHSNKAGPKVISGMIGDSVTVTCNPGWSGSGTTVCGSDLQWNSLPTCVANICTCPFGTPTVFDGTGATLCDTATVDCSVCADGYTLSAAAASGSAQTCDANTCTPTGNVANSNKETAKSITAVLRVIVDSSLIKISQPNKYLRPSFLFTAPCIIP